MGVSFLRYHVRVVFAQGNPKQFNNVCGPQFSDPCKPSSRFSVRLDSKDPTTKRGIFASFWTEGVSFLEVALSGVALKGTQRTTTPVLGGPPFSDTPLWLHSLFDSCACQGQMAWLLWVIGNDHGSFQQFETTVDTHWPPPRPFVKLQVFSFQSLYIVERAMDTKGVPIQKQLTKVSIVYCSFGADMWVQPKVPTNIREETQILP